MFDSVKELLDQIRLGEDSLLELKEVRFSGERVSGPPRDSLADELAALANSSGGVCVLGVEDATHEVVGIPVGLIDRVEAFVREICNDSIEPTLHCVIRKLWLPTTLGTEAAVLKVEVPRSLFVHVSPGGYFHRIGTSKRKMSPEYLARLFQQRSQARIIRFDEQAIADGEIGHLDEALWERFRTKYSAADPVEAFLGKLGLARQDEGRWRPTVAGVLLASRDPRQFLPNAYVQAVAYRGTGPTPGQSGRNYQLDAADIAGPLDEQLSGALGFVARNMRVEAEKTVGRLDKPQFSMAAVFEAVANALAHRDYGIHGSKIRLRLFSDRLELYSPGALANTMTVESLVSRQSARNEVLTSLLARCPIPVGIPWLGTDRRTIMDKRGEGIRIIFEETEAIGGRRPEYRLIDGEELLLTIPGATSTGADGESGDEAGGRK